MYKFDSTVYADGTTPITFRFISNYIGSDSPYNFKSPREFSFLCEMAGLSTANLSVRYKANAIADSQNAATSQVTDTIAISTGTKFYNDYNIIGRGKLFELDLLLTTGCRVTIGDMKLRTVIEGDK